MFKLVDVSKYYNSNGIVTIALQHINLEFKKNDIVAITGESGSGKSTLLNVICQNDTYDDGEIYFKGNETSYFDINDQDNFKNKYIGFIYQNYNIIDSYTVLQNVMFPLLINGYSYEEAKEKALGYIEKVGLSHRVNHKGTKLSGGEKQRVVIARALASEKEVLACDEPTGNLDSETSKEIIELIKEIAKDKLVLIVTHNYEEVKDIATRKVTLVDGKVIEDRVLKEVEDDNDEDIDLTETKISKGNLFRFTKNNVLATPKKTIFTFLLMFVMTFVIIAMFQGVNYSYNNNSTYSNDYLSYYGDGLFIIQNKDKSALDVEALEDLRYDVNIYSYVLSLSYSTSDGNMGILPFIPEYSTIEGKLPSNDYEGLILIPSSYNMENYTYYINQSLMLHDGSQYTVTGVVSCDDLNRTCFYSQRLDLEHFYNYAINSEIVVSLLTIDNEVIEPNFSRSNAGFIIRLPYGYKEIKDVIITVGGAYDVDIPYTIQYGDLSSPSITFPYSIDFNEFYEASVYTSDYKNAQKYFRDLGYEVYVPSENTTIDTYSYISLIFTTILCILPVFVIYFVTYKIFRAIYDSKYRQYTIMRIIGINKKDMSKLILLETFSVTFISSLITFILTIILGYSFNIILFKQLNTYIVLTFVLIMLAFSLFLALRVNNKLFNTTTAKALRGN